MPRIQKAAQAAVVAVAVFFAQSASAGILYDFSWGFDSLSATGTMELNSSVGIGESFDISDVLAIDLELFDGGVSVQTIASPPDEFDPPFDTIKGTRNASNLSMIDFVLSFGPLFGCTAGDCLSGEVFFPGVPPVDFGSITAARESFVLTELPEPGTELLLPVAVLSLAAVRRRRGTNR